MSALPARLRWLPLTALVPDGEETCFCLRVTHPSRCYVTESGIVTHNTDTTGAVDALPPKPKAFVEALLTGMDPEPAAVLAGYKPGESSEAARNIGRFLASKWSDANGSGTAALTEAQALDELALRVGPASARRNPSSFIPHPSSPSALSRAGWNHVDKFVTSKLGAAFNAVRHTSPAQALETALTKMWNAPTVEPARAALEFLRKQFTPLNVLDREANAILQEMRIGQAFAKETAMDVARSIEGKAHFSNLAWPADVTDTPGMRARLWHVMRGEADQTSIPPALAAYGEKLRALLVEAGQHGVSAGRLSADTFQTLTETYLPHYYIDEAQGPLAGMFAKFKLGMQDIRAQRTTAWHITDSTRKDETGLPRLVPWSENNKRWRFTSEEHRNAFYEELIREETYKSLQGRHDRSLSRITRQQLQNREQLDPETRGRVKEIMRDMRQRFTKERPLTTEEQEKAGLITDPVYAVVRYVAQMEHDNATADMFNELAKRTDLVSDTPLVDFVQIPDHGRFGRLAGRYVPKVLAEQILETVSAPDGAAQLYDALLAMWKSGKTVWNPGTHARNILGNLMFAQLAGTSTWNPANATYYAQAWRAIREGGDDARELFAQGVLGADFSSAELRSELKALLPDPLNIVGDLSTLTRVSMALHRKWSKLSSGVHWAYSTEDAVFKAAAYFKARAMGLTETDARDHVRKWFPYYDNIGTSFAIKNLKRFGMPFFSFTRESLRIFGHAAKERPIALAAALALPSLLTAMSAALLGLSDRDKKDVLRDMRGRGRFLLRDRPIMSILLPNRDGRGRLQQFDLSNILPFADFVSQRRDDPKQHPWWQELALHAVSGSPVTGLLYAAATSRDPYSNRNIWEEDMGDGEKAMQYAKHAWSVLSPPLAPGGTGTSTIAQSFERSTNKTLEKRNTPQAVMRALLGFDVRNASPDLYRLAEDFRAAHKLTVNEIWAGGTNAQQRARMQLFAQLAQDEPDLDGIGETLAFLKQSGKPVQTAQDIQKLLFYRNPIMLVRGQENQSAFRASLTGESRALLEEALAEFNKISARAPGIIARARVRHLQTQHASP